MGGGEQVVWVRRRGWPVLLPRDCGNWSQFSPSFGIRTSTFASTASTASYTAFSLQFLYLKVSFLNACVTFLCFLIDQKYPESNCFTCLSSAGCIKAFLHALVWEISEFWDPGSYFKPEPSPHIHRWAVSARAKQATLPDASATDPQARRQRAPLQGATHHLFGLAVPKETTNGTLCWGTGSILFPGAALTKYHKRGGLNRNVLCHSREARSLRSIHDDGPPPFSCCAPASYSS